MRGRGDIQNFVNTAYPPTHTFNVGTMKPSGVLRDRVRNIEVNFPDFFHADCSELPSLLDIGCNKGFFSLAFMDCFSSVTGIDTDPECIAVCRRLNGGLNVHFLNVGFRDFYDDHQYERVMIGNGPHHLFTEAGGHEWIAKLAALSSDQVLIEGPMDTNNKEFKDFPKGYDSFVSEMGRFFHLVGMCDSVSYTPERKLSVWRRRWHQEKRFKDMDDYWVANQVSVMVASSTPISNGMSHFTKGGWAEDSFSTAPVVDTQDAEMGRRVFRRYCEGQAYLARIGFTNIDPGVINFVERGGELWNFDKSHVMPILAIEEKHVEVWLTLVGNQSMYRGVVEPFVGRIYAALASRDSREIERTYREVVEAL